MPRSREFFVRSDLKGGISYIRLIGQCEKYEVESSQKKCFPGCVSLVNTFALTLPVQFNSYLLHWKLSLHALPDLTE